MFVDMPMPLFSRVSVLKLYNLSFLPLHIFRFSYLESKLFIVIGRPVSCLLSHNVCLHAVLCRPLVRSFIVDCCTMVG